MIKSVVIHVEYDRNSAMNAGQTIDAVNEIQRQVPGNVPVVVILDGGPAALTLDDAFRGMDGVTVMLSHLP